MRMRLLLRPCLAGFRIRTVAGTSESMRSSPRQCRPLQLQIWTRCASRGYKRRQRKRPCRPRPAAGARELQVVAGAIHIFADTSAPPPHLPPLAGVLAPIPCAPRRPPPPRLVSGGARQSTKALGWSRQRDGSSMQMARASSRCLRQRMLRPPPQPSQPVPRPTLSPLTQASSHRKWWCVPPLTHKGER
jgi:hypothetical protein